MPGKIRRNAPCPCGSGKKYKKCCVGLSVAHPSSRSRRVWLGIVGITIAGILGCGGLLLAMKDDPVSPSAISLPVPSPTPRPVASAVPQRQNSIQRNAPVVLPSNSLLSKEEIAQYDILTLNLLCARGLPGVMLPDIQPYQTTLAMWAEHAGQEIEKYLYKFKADPHDYNNSEAYYRMLTLITVLEQDFRIRYNPELISYPNLADTRTKDGFFRNARDIFLHGLIDRRVGTCTSLPVLTVAVGRLLGYPLHLVTAKGHLFVRWDDGRERFNIDSAGNGMNSPPDERYYTWPFPLTEEEIQSGFFLKTHSRVEEYAIFLELRASCLRDNDMPIEAMIVYEHIRSLVPSHPYIDRLITAALYEANQQRQQASIQDKEN